MDQAKLLLPLQCPDHKDQVIGLLNMEPGAKKVGYCYDCIAEEGGDCSFVKKLKPVSKYLDYCSSVYKKCPKRVLGVERPAEYIEEFSKKDERLESFPQHIEQEKERVKEIFEEIRKILNQIINEKEEDCLKRLDKETFCLEETYRIYEKLLMMGWPEDTDIENIYPGIDTLKQRMSQINNVDELQAFMAGFQQDVWMQSFPFVEDDLLFRIKKKLDGLIRNLNIIEGSLPKIQGQILNLENMENLMKDLVKGFIQEEVQIENSLVSRMKASTYQSKIIVDDQFETLRDWLPKGYKFDLKLLFRGSVDGMSEKQFHEKCDGKGATITLIKCRFNGAPSSSTLGGFIDQSWHSNGNYSSSKEAFLFSLAEQSQNSVKCPILDPQIENAFRGCPTYGPTFGGGFDLYIYGGLMSGTLNPKSYSNSIALQNGHGNTFTVEEVEVYQVL